MGLALSESQQQIAVVEYCDARGIPCAHIPNEGKRNKYAGAQLKRQGLRKGFPDLVIPVARGKYHSLYIEMKDYGGKPTKEQVEWIHKLRAQGMCAFVCIGARNAIELIERYMAM